MSTKAHDFYDSMGEFETLLEDARMQASSDKEETFVKETKAKYDEWGLAMFWSDKQDKWLRSIAGPEDW